ncbi:MAG: ABC transporter permease [Methanobacteriaceae archaeon]|nr:ABC transporter permease [Methanobacteriaceae archaeon]
MLYKKMIRDLSDHKLQFIAIFLMIFLAVGTFVGIGSEGYGVEEQLNKYYDQTNMANVWLYNDNFDNIATEKIQNMSATKQLERQLVISTIENQTNNPEVDLHFVENNTLSKYYPVTGSDLNIDDTDGVWLDKKYADAHQLSVGDKISFDFNGTTINKTVKGLGYSPEYVYETPKKSIIPDPKLQGFAYLSYKAFPSADNISYNTLLIKTDSNTTEYHQQLDNVMDKYTTYLSLENHNSHKVIESEIQQHIMMGAMFPIVFVVVALLTLLTTMTRIVSNQRTIIGVLKSLGFSNKTIIRHYLTYPVVLTITGSIAGYIIGIICVPPLFYPTMSEFYTIPVWTPGFNISFILVPAIIVILSILFTYLAVRNISKESPADTLEPKSPKISKARFIDKTKFWRNLSFNIKWNIRDMNRSKVRSFVTILGMLGCTMLLVASFGMNDAMYDLGEWQYGGISHYNSQIVLEDNATGEEISNLVDKYKGLQVMTTNVEIKHNGIEKSAPLSVYNRSNLITPTDKYKKNISYDDNGIYVTEKTAQLLDIKVGDTIEWHIYGEDKWVNTTITGICANPSTQGIVMTPAKLDSIGLNFTPTTIVTSRSDVDKNLDGINSVNTISELKGSWDQMVEVFYSMIALLLVLSVVLSVIILYSLNVLSFTESLRDFATLKVIGFKSRAIQKLFITKNLFLSIVGFILGVPVGFYVLRLLMESSGENFYYPINYSWTAVLYSFILVILVSLLVNYLLSRKIKKINMVESLKKGRE